MVVDLKTAGERMSEEEVDTEDRVQRTYLSFEKDSKIGRKIKWLKMAGFSSEEIVNQGIPALVVTERYTVFIDELKADLNEAE